MKQEAQEMIQNLPDNCTYKDIQYHLYGKTMGKALIKNNESKLVWKKSHNE